mgnify:CR=1 FL=1
MKSFFAALGRARAFQALRHREFRLVCGSQVLGNLGFWMDELSRLWLIYQLTDSMVQLGLARGVQFLPLLLFAPFAGMSVDELAIALKHLQHFEPAGVVSVSVFLKEISRFVKAVGDGKGRAGFGHGKAREVPEAISKATASAKKKMMRVPLKEGRTLHHDGRGHFGAGKVTVRSAPAGTGIIAGGPMRAVFESLGVADVVTKSVGTSNPYNMIRATFEALGEQTSPKSVAQRRGKKVADLLRRGGASAEVAQADAEAIAE